MRVRKIIDVFQTIAVHEGNCLISVEPQINLRSGKLRNTVDYFWGHWMRPVVCVCLCEIEIRILIDNFGVFVESILKGPRAFSPTSWGGLLLSNYEANQGKRNQ